MSSIQSLIFTDNFIEIKLLLPDGKLYGIGERRGSVELNDTDWWEHRKGRFFMVFAQFRSFFPSSTVCGIQMVLQGKTSNCTVSIQFG